MSQTCSPNCQQNYALKLNQVSHAAWNAPNTNLPPSQPNGSTPASQTQSQPQSQPLVQGPLSGPLQPTPAQPSSQGQQVHNNNPQSQTQPSQQHLNAPPGVPLPGVSPYASNGSHPLQPPHPHAQLHSSLAQPPNQPHHHPQTPAQQVLISAADRWGLLGLLAMIKNASVDADGGLSSVGTDLGAVGLDMGYEG